MLSQQSEKEVKLSVRNSHNKSIGAIPEAQLELMQQSIFVSNSIDSDNLIQKNNGTKLAFMKGALKGSEKKGHEATRKHKQNSCSADLLQKNIESQQ